MLERWLRAILEDPALDPKMWFIAGPRQTGKTTLARSILNRHDSDQLLFNWDVPRLFATKLGNIPVIQLVREHGVLEAEGRSVVIVSASRFLAS